MCWEIGIIISSLLLRCQSSCLNMHVVVKKEKKRQGRRSFPSKQPRVVGFLFFFLPSRRKKKGRSGAGFVFLLPFYFACVGKSFLSGNLVHEIHNVLITKPTSFRENCAPVLLNSWESFGKMARCSCSFRVPL